MKDKTNNKFYLCRKTIGLKQYEVAEKLNIVRSTVSKWESGASIPDQSILPKVAKLYNVSIDYLLSEDNCDEIKPMTYKIPIVYRSKGNTEPKRMIEITEEQYQVLLDIVEKADQNRK